MTGPGSKVVMFDDRRVPLRPSIPDPARPPDICSSPHGWPWNRRRYESYLKIMKRPRCTPGPSSKDCAGGTRARTAGGAPDLEAGIACNVDLRRERLHRLRGDRGRNSHGTRVPENLSVFGFDALDEFIYYRPRITRCGADKERIGEYCALLVDPQVEGEDLETRRPFASHAPRRGESCAPAHRIREILWNS